jgi:hypothetical protein
LIFYTAKQFIKSDFLIREFYGRMPSSEMLHCVALVKTDVKEERSASIIRATRIGERGTKLAVTLRRNNMSVLTKL